MMNEVLKKWYDEHGQELKDWALALWETPEVAMEEFNSAAVTAEFMKKYGFTVEAYHCKDSSLPANTVVATWGSGHPVVGIIGEYDALPGCGQECVPYKSAKPGNGQGCGHNLMSPAAGAAAVAIKAAMEAEGLTGTVKFFACPAEEIVEGKMHLARDGVFEGMDCCMAWHPEGKDLQIRENVQNSMTNMIVEFYGTTAHAASAPEKGRSALDACELMNIGINYLREHVEPTTRMHYSYLSAGDKPNVVPRYAAVHYFLRSKDLKSNYELYERVKKIAAGAALMTETEHKIIVNAMVTGCAQNDGMNNFLYEAAMKVPPLTYTEEEMAYANELFKNIHGREPNEGESVISTTILKPTNVHVNSPGSTDAGYVTRLAPTSRLVGWGMINGTPMHSWGAVAAVGHELGLKAALHASMAQAQCGYEVMKNPEVTKAWREELDALLGGEGDLKPIFPERVS